MGHRLVDMFGFFVVHLWTELKFGELWWVSTISYEDYEAISANKDGDYEPVTLRNGQALSLPGGGDSDRVGKLGLVTVSTCSNLDR